MDQLRYETRIVAGIDIGTTKCVAVVAEIDTNGAVRVLAQGRSIMRGVTRGQIVDVDQAVLSVKEAVDDLVRIYHDPLPRFLLTISGEQIYGKDTAGTQPISGQYVTEQDIKDAEILALGNLELEPDDRLIKSERVSFTYRNSENVDSVLGQKITKFKLRMHAAIGDVVTCDNLIKTIRRNNLYEAQILPQGWASAYAVLTEEERMNGALVLDIGADTTDICVMQNGAPRLTMSVPAGGNDITRQLAGYMHCSMQEAEKIKQRLDMRALPETEKVFINVVQTHTGQTASFTVYELSLIVARVYQSWVDGIFLKLLEAQWFRTKDDGAGRYWPENHRLPAGVVITGGGSLITQAAYLFQNQAGPFGYTFTTRCGSPLYRGEASIGLTSPKESAVMGLIFYAANELKNGRDVLAGTDSSRPTVSRRIKGFLKRFFIGEF